MQSLDNPGFEDNLFFVGSMEKGETLIGVEGHGDEMTVKGIQMVERPIVTGASNCGRGRLESRYRETKYS